MAGFDFYVDDNALDRDDKAMVILKINHDELIEVNVRMYLDRVGEFCDFLRVASRTIIWPLSEQMWMCLIPLLHCLNGRFAEQG